MPSQANPRCSNLPSPAAALAACGATVRQRLAVVVGIALAAALHFTLPSAIGPYYTQIVIDVGIAMILAVSLNIVNGMTGQFSLGHAAFMALGGYAAGMITYYGSLLMWGTPAQHGGFLGVGDWLFVVGLHRRRAAWRRRPVTSSACRRCDCAATIWRS